MSARRHLIWRSPRTMLTGVTENIAQYLRDKPNQMAMTLETMQSDFEAFWQWIGAEGDLAAALKTFAEVQNASKPTTGVVRDTPLRLRISRKIRRLAANLPTFLRET